METPAPQIRVWSFYNSPSHLGAGAREPRGEGSGGQEGDARGSLPAGWGLAWLGASCCSSWERPQDPYLLARHPSASWGSHAQGDSGVPEQSSRECTPCASGSHRPPPQPLRCTTWPSQLETPAGRRCRVGDSSRRVILRTKISLQIKKEEPEEGRGEVESLGTGKAEPGSKPSEAPVSRDRAQVCPEGPP